MKIEIIIREDHQIGPGEFLEKAHAQIANGVRCACCLNTRNFEISSQKTMKCLQAAIEELQRP